MLLISPKHWMYISDSIQNAIWYYIPYYKDKILDLVFNVKIGLELLRRKTLQRFLKSK